MSLGCQSNVSSKILFLVLQFELWTLRALRINAFFANVNNHQSVSLIIVLFERALAPFASIPFVCQNGPACRLSLRTRRAPCVSFVLYFHEGVRSTYCYWTGHFWHQLWFSSGPYVVSPPNFRWSVPRSTVPDPRTSWLIGCRSHSFYYEDCLAHW